MEPSQKKASAAWYAASELRQELHKHAQRLEQNLYPELADEVYALLDVVDEAVALFKQIEQDGVPDAVTLDMLSGEAELALVKETTETVDVAEELLDYDLIENYTEAAGGEYFDVFLNDDGRRLQQAAQ